MITLPTGCRIGGERHPEAELRLLTGADEAAVAEAGGPPAEIATLLLSRCVRRLGPVEEVSAELVRSLTAGDREALLLHLRRLSFGERLDCLLSCPECDEQLDLELSVEDVLVPPYSDAAETYEATVATGDGPRTVRFRLPTGADQEEAVRHADDVDLAVRLLVRRCTGRDLEAEEVERIGERMAELDPQAEIMLAAACPACGGSSLVPFDSLGFLLAEAAAGRDELYREVHALALNYGWSEAEILSLPTARRRLYLELIAEAG